MVEINLTQEKSALVDDGDFEYLNQWKWYASKSKRTFYAKRNLYINGKYTTIKMHRELLRLKKEDKIQVDHKDGNGLNNQKNNLRICTQNENQHNSRKRYDNTSEYKGVSWHKRDKKWFAQICFQNKNLFLGYFNDKTEAALSYDKKARELFGEFSKTNFIDVSNWT